MATFNSVLFVHFKNNMLYDGDNQFFCPSNKVNMALSLKVPMLVEHTKTGKCTILWPEDLDNPIRVLDKVEKESTSNEYYLIVFAWVGNFDSYSEAKKYILSKAKKN